ncbi:ABC transporter ATP-binding protein [Veronia nyctiphanis]|uniref:ABC transporter ATP-binding protein n=1 Tax=Veronia nyctiphanis TaxID=1278244 RepID=A0A4Q0YPS2_9GAMM|nr:ABC transporter ATP-binding protein [Veronia nyctiphanis]RXJ73060.1 ABC transporter ATP-binding protein [Veronia nyctiphanis]
MKTTFSLLSYIFRMLFSASPVIALLFLVLMVIQGLMPAINIKISMMLGDAFQNGDIPQWLPLLWAATFALPIILQPLINLFQLLLNDKLTRKAQVQIMKSASAIPDLATLEKTEIHDTIEVMARESAHRPLGMVVNAFTLLRVVLVSVSLMVVLASLGWWLPVALMLPLLPLSWSTISAKHKLFLFILRHGKEPRRFKYFLQTILDPKKAEETRLFKLAPFFIEKYQQSYDKYLKSIASARVQTAISPQKWSLLYVISLGITFYYLTPMMTSSTFSVGDLMGLVQSLALFSVNSSVLAVVLGSFGDSLPFFKKMKELEDIEPEITFKYYGLPLPEDKTIRFHNVSFSYPDGRPALKNISLTINDGEHIALVGENGAGKSTLIKLLCRFYDPTEGYISIGGIDIRDLDLDSWREYLGAVFQNFGRYDLTIEENIALGSTASMNKPEVLAQAAHDAKFPLSDTLSLDAQLGKEFDGTDLSGGQWQRLALARSLVRECGLIMLDEPTSAMDPRVETELFKQFAALMQGRTALMVTHRLGSVNMLNRVIVLKQGEITEDGSPEALKQSNGEYAELWKLQAEQYEAKESSDQTALEVPA